MGFLAIENLAIRATPISLIEVRSTAVTIACALSATAGKSSDHSGADYDGHCCFGEIAGIIATSIGGTRIGICAGMQKTDHRYQSSSKNRTLFHDVFRTKQWWFYSWRRKNDSAVALLLAFDDFAQDITSRMESSSISWLRGHATFHGAPDGGIVSQ